MPSPWIGCEARASYDALIVGADAHALATAVALVRDHGLTSVAVIAERPPGAEAEGAAVFSAALCDQNAALDALALNSWVRLPDQFACPSLLDRRDLLMVVQTHRDQRSAQRWVYAHCRRGGQATWNTADQVSRICPRLQIEGSQFPVLGAASAPVAGVVRRQAAEWAFGREARRLGVDVIVSGDVHGLSCDDQGRVCGVQTASGLIRSPLVALTDTRLAHRLLAVRGQSLRLRSRTVVRLDSQAVKPCLDHLLWSSSGDWVLVQQDDGTVILEADCVGTALLTQGQRWAMAERVAAAVMQTLPSLSRLRMTRFTCSIDAVGDDGSPILGESGVDGLLLSVGWGRRQALCAPASAILLAHHMTTGQPHPLAQDLDAERFTRGRQVCEWRDPHHLFGHPGENGDSGWGDGRILAETRARMRGTTMRGGLAVPVQAMEMAAAEESAGEKAPMAGVMGEEA